MGHMGNMGNVSEYMEFSSPVAAMSQEIDYEDTQRQERAKLDSECRQLQEKISLLENRNKDVSLLKPRNFFVVGFISFFLGFIFA